LNGLVTLPAPWVPFATMGMSVVLGSSPLPDLFGILAGHVWYFGTVVYPRTQGGRWVGGVGAG
jgi:Derlin-2/3